MSRPLHEKLARELYEVLGHETAACMARAPIRGTRLRFANDTFVALPTPDVRRVITALRLLEQVEREPSTTPDTTGDPR